MAGAATTTEKDEKALAADAEKAAKAAGDKAATPGAVKAIKAAVPPKVPPKTTSRFWLGLFAGGPLSYLTVPGATFHVKTGQYVPTGNPEHPYEMNQSPGGLIDLLPEQVKEIARWIGARVVRWRGEVGDLRAGFAVLDMMRSEEGYDGGRPSDVPLGRYCFMLQAEQTGGFGGKQPEPMA